MLSIHPPSLPTYPLQGRWGAYPSMQWAGNGVHPVHVFELWQETRYFTTWQPKSCSFSNGLLSNLLTINEAIYKEYLSTKWYQIFYGAAL